MDKSTPVTVVTGTSNGMGKAIAEAVSQTPAQFAAFIQAESVKWGRVVKESGASLD